MKPLLSLAVVLALLCGFAQQPAAAEGRGPVESSASGQVLRTAPPSAGAAAHLSFDDAQTAQGGAVGKVQMETPAAFSEEAAADLKKGLAEVERKDFRKAERYFRAALKADPKMAEAAYNLGIVIFKDRPEEALTWLKKARDLRGDYPKYAYALASYTLKKGDTDKGIRLLRDLIGQYPQYVNAYRLLGETYEQKGRVDLAAAVYRQATEEKKLPQPARSFFSNKLKALPPPKKAAQ